MQKYISTLGEICDEVGGAIRTGPFGSQLHQSDYQDEGIPVVMPKDIVGEKLSEESIARIGVEDVARLSQHILKEGDIVYGRRGDIGRQAIISKKEAGWLCGTGCLRISLGDKVLDPNFLHFYLMQEDVIEWIYRQAVGATMPNLNTNILRSVPVEYPPIETQRQIASILSTYDDLIENNTRRIKILEDMARMIYREWFVNFRFSGYEKVKMVDSPLGKIPEGWEIKQVQETFEILGGGTPSTKETAYWDGGKVNWYSPTDLTSKGTLFMDASATQITELGLQKSSARLFPAFSVMMTSRATLGVISINTTDACTNQGFITCIPNERFPLFTLYFWLRENVDQFVSLATGATFKEITKGVFKTIELALPPAKHVYIFEEHIGSIGKQLLNLQRKNQNLRQTRDLLLPKLISGEIEIDAEKQSFKPEVA